jgi:hypothetical protein
LSKKFDKQGQTTMDRFLAAVVLAVAALTASAAARAQQEQLTATTATAAAASAAPAMPDKADGTRGMPGGDVNPLPAAPTGKSTIFGGEIRNIDPVRDVLTLKVYGQSPMKILFDERTQVYLDGKQIPLHALSPEGHASVETTLDGTKVFAVSIHELSRSPEGDYSGRVVSYDPGSGELTIASGATRELLKVRVAREAVFTREGQTAFTSIRSGSWDLRTGSLVTIEFGSDNAGRGVADKINVYAVPGSAFDFSGSIASLNLGNGRLVLVDPRDQKSYDISFNAARLPAGKTLHLGDHVSVKAEYDGTNYVASDITPE